MLPCSCVRVTGEPCDFPRVPLITDMVASQLLITPVKGRGLKALHTQGAHARCPEEQAVKVIAMPHVGLRDVLSHAIKLHKALTPSTAAPPAPQVLPYRTCTRVVIVVARSPGQRAEEAMHLQQNQAHKTWQLQLCQPVSCLSPSHA
jgi:hypothetical protein